MEVPSREVGAMEVGCARRFITIEVGGMGSREEIPFTRQSQS